MLLRRKGAESLRCRSRDLPTRRRTKVRQRGQARLKSHIKWGNPPILLADFNFIKDKIGKISVFDFFHISGFCSALNDSAPLSACIKKSERCNLIIIGDRCAQNFISRELALRGGY